MKSSQLSMMSDFVPRMGTRISELTKVARKMIPKTAPPTQDVWGSVRSPRTKKSLTSEINGPKSEVEKQVGLAPDERKSESDDSCGQEASIEESPGKHEMLGHHLGRVMVGVREALSRRLLQDDVLPENVEC